MTDIAPLQKLLDPLFPGLMGVRLVACAADRVAAEMEVRADLCTAGGILHGGAYMAFADTLGAVGTIVNLAPGKRTTTTDSSTKFMAGARLGTIVSLPRASPLHRGRTTMVWQTPIRMCRRQALRRRHADAARARRCVVRTRGCRAAAPP